MQQAIKAEKILTAKGIITYALPTPREIAVSCGQCLLFAAGQQTTVLDLFAADKVRWSKLFSRNVVGNGVYIYEKLAEYGGWHGTTAADT